MSNIETRLAKSVKYIKGKISITPEIGLILGSGLGSLADQIQNPVFLPYENIPNFPVSTVEGHAGRLVVGTLEGKNVIAMQGRFHFYEGYPIQDVTFPVRVMKLLGVQKLAVTNAAGAVNKEFNPGDLMLLTDHLNMQGTNALIGPNLKEFGPRFPDMSTPYHPEMMDAARKAAAELNIEIKEGVYACMSGPSYETPAEVRMLRTLGSDAVGMSTVPEVVVAVHSGIKALGISCITNMAAGVLDQPLNHEEVIETSARVRELFIKLMTRIVATI